VAAGLSGGGQWLGQADEQGLVRIDLGPNVNLTPQQTVRFSVVAAPEPTASFMRPGLPLGELSLTAARKLVKR
jgi:hypothetical protein